MLRVSHPMFDTRMLSVRVPADTGVGIDIVLRPGGVPLPNSLEFGLADMAQRVNWVTGGGNAAIVGRVPETGHYRNVRRHKVITDPRIVTVRVDESLTYLNARWLEEFVLETIADHPQIAHLVLMCSAVNAIDASALESLEAINHRLSDAGVRLHLSEVKGPVMDKLQRSDFLQRLSGQVFLTHHQAATSLAANTGLEHGQEHGQAARPV